MHTFSQTQTGRRGPGAFLKSRYLFLAFPLAIIFAVTLTTSSSALAQGSGQPPLIDRELFFGNPEISGSQISPDGQFISFLKPYKDTRNIWVKRTNEPFSSARLITNDTKRPVTSYFWSRDGKYILFVQDQGGDENYNVYAVNPAESPAAGQEVPMARNLTSAKGVRAVIYSVPRNDPDTIYVGLNDRDKSWHDLYRVKISTSERTLMRQNTERIASWFFDNKGQLRMAVRTTDKGDTEILRVDDKGFTQVYSCNVFETCGPVRFHKDNQRIYMITNKGDQLDLTRLVLFDPSTGKDELVESDPLNRVDFGDAEFSNVTDELIATVYEDSRTRIYWKDKPYEADYKLLQSKLPGKEINLGSSTKDERIMLIAASSDTEPGERYLFDRNTKKLTQQYRVFEKLPREQLAQMKPISYKSSDGLEIPAFLTLPKGVAPKNLPLIVFPHGGPWARDSWGYNIFAQFWANRGYAVLLPNFRSSTGYGKKFLNAGNNEWGQKMQDDLTWGVKYLIAQGIADPKRVGIMGGSYGGYATLAGLTFTPDLYAAGVSYVGPSNLLTLLKSIPPYWEAGRIIFHTRMGNPNTPEGHAQLEHQSPLNSADKIKAPLLVIQGANDPRVNKAESDQIVVALRDRGFPVEYIVAPDEGHGFARPINNMAMIATAEKFFAKHLGGRYQESTTPELAQRLREITVDVKTVELLKRVETPSAGTPKPAIDLSAGTSNYKGVLEVAGQTIPITLTRVIKEEGGTWVVTESAVLPMGTLSDASTLEKGSLVLRKRTINQGPIVVELEVKDNKATGTMTMNGQSRPIAVDTGGALFADGAGATAVMAALPLADGYTVTFRNFDVQSQQVKVKQLKVVGTEKVTIAVGTFDTFKVEITSAEGEGGKTTLWIAKDSHKVVKTAATLPQLNGATIAMELTQ
jgi:dipeptidyl aminopeptidase/acylaminoacyl peptidase